MCFPFFLLLYFGSENPAQSPPCIPGARLNFLSTGSAKSFLVGQPRPLHLAFA